jgi:hypothetical protein
VADWEIKAISSSVSFLRNFAGLPAQTYKTRKIVFTDLNDTHIK